MHHFWKPRDSEYFNVCIDLKLKGIYKDLVRFCYVDSFHIGMEMLLSVYIIEMFVLFTPYCLKNTEEVNITPFVVFLPFIIAILITLGCALWAMRFFQAKAKEYTDRYFIDETSDGDGKITNKTEEEIKQDKKLAFDNFVELKQEHCSSILAAHYMCICFYVIFSFVISFVLWIATDMFNDSFVLYTTLIGMVLGIFWNFAGYYRHQRILWCRFFSIIKDHPDKEEFEDIRRKDVEDNCKYHRWSIGTIIASLVVLLLMFAIVAVKFCFKIESVSILGLLKEGYGTLFIPFFSLAIIYVKLCYVISFDHNDEAIFCPSLEAAISEYPEIRKKEEKKKLNMMQSKEHKIELIVQKLNSMGK